MKNPNPQIQNIIAQTQYTYLYWYVFLNLLSINDIFLCWDGEQVQLFQWDGEEFVLLLDKDKNDVGPTEKEEVEGSKENDLHWSKKEGLDALPLYDIKQNAPDFNPAKKPMEDIKLPKKKFGKFPLTIIASREKSDQKPNEDREAVDSKNYKSPARKLIVFFEKSRDNWKSKCIDAKEELKLAKKNNKNLRESKKILKEKVKYLEAEVSKLNSAKEVLEQEVQELQKNVGSMLETAQSLNVVPKSHQYPIGVIYMYVSLVLTASTSLRGASKALDVFISTLNLDCSTPSWPCGRLWLLRLGYYKLTRLKEFASDWIWIVDHIIILTNKKCFVITG